MKSFSVLILTYNTDYRRIILSIESVLRQNFSNYEIIIADDASENNHFADIQNYFKEKNFTDYTLIKNDTNLGTVINFYNAIKKAKGKYIKGLGAGDLLYDNNTLMEMYNFLHSNNYKCCFGRLSSFYTRNRKIIKSGFSAPEDLDIYRSNNIPVKLILFNLVNSHDWISGSTMFFDREYMLKYIKELIGRVKYTEDLVQILIYLDKGRIYYFDKYVIWYEQGAGISTGKSIKWKHIIQKDFDNFYKHIKVKYGFSKSKVKKYNNLLNVFNYLMKLILLNNNKSSNSNKCIGFLDEKSFLDIFYDKFD